MSYWKECEKAYKPAPRYIFNLPDGEKAYIYNDTTENVDVIYKIIECYNMSAEDVARAFINCCGTQILDAELIEYYLRVDCDLVYDKIYDAERDGEFVPDEYDE